jgi:hypothetical protein
MVVFGACGGVRYIPSRVHGLRLIEQCKAVKQMGGSAIVQDRPIATPSTSLEPSRLLKKRSSR